MARNTRIRAVFDRLGRGFPGGFVETSGRGFGGGTRGWDQWGSKSGFVSLLAGPIDFVGLMGVGVGIPINFTLVVTIRSIGNENLIVD